MKENIYFEATCIDLTVDGKGIVKNNGRTYFVNHMLVGETGKLLIIKELKSYGVARLIELIDPSPYRIEPRCSIFKQCGGCQLQHLDYSKQLDIKKKRVEDVMERIAKVDIRVHDVVGQSDPWFYRNKVQVPVGLVKGELETGFYKQHSNDIIPMEQCFIQNEISNQLVNRVKELLRKYQIEPYDKISHNGVVRHILTKYGFHSHELMLVLIVRKKKFKYKNTIVEALVKEFPMLKSIVLNINTKDDNVILGDEEIVLYGKDYIVDTLNGLKFHISSKSFYQINPEQVEKLYTKAIELADFKGNERVIDAYCGIGTIGLSLASKVKEVIGVEIVDQAIENAKYNAKLNHLDNAKFVVGDAGKFMVNLAKAKEHIDVVITDPPRKGCSKEFIEAIDVLKPDKVVYISCDVSTQARDLALFKEIGYTGKDAYPFDLFPHTMHVETVVLMSRIEK